MQENLKEYTQKIIEIWENESTNCPKLKNKMEHSRRVGNYVKILSKVDDYEFYGWVHDLGRIEQYHKIGNFDDNKYNHANAGIDYINNNNIEYLKNFEEAKNIIFYHSFYNYCPDNKKSIILYYLTIADQLDNALTCKNYLLDEETTNNKNFSYSNELSNYFKEALNNQNIYVDKRYCETYLDYFFFAFTLVLRVLNYKEVTILLSNENINNQFIDTFAFFKTLFLERLDKDTYNKVIELLNKFNRFNK